MAIYKEVTELDCTVIGSPTISDSFVLSGISSSSYVAKNLPDVYEGTNKLILMCTQTTLQKSNWAFSSTLNHHTGFDRYGRVIMYCGDLGTLNGVSTYSTNQKVWLCLVSTGGASVENRTITLYSLGDSGYNLDTLPPLSAWRIELTANDRPNLFSSDTLFIGVNSVYHPEYFRGTVDLTTVAFYSNDSLVWKAVNKLLVDVSGSVEITKGSYGDGTNTIIMPASTYNIDALTANQTTGGKNELFAYTDSTGSAGALITSTTPTGSFKITKDLEQPIYLDPTKNYIAGGELIEPTVSFVGTDISSTKALQYSEAQDTTYWAPSGATASLDSVKAIQSVGPANDLYLTTTAGTPTASLSFSDDGEIVGAATKLPLKSKVYLNNETDAILGIQERPDEVVISKNTLMNYTVVGSPTISDSFVLSGISSSSYVTKDLPDNYEGTNKLILMCTQTTLQDTNWAFSSARNHRAGFNSSGKVIMYCGGVLGIIEGVSTYSTNQKVWLCSVITGGVSVENRILTLYSLGDSGYNLDTLPPLSEWRTELTASSRPNLFSSDTLSLGVSQADTSQYFKGTIDLTTVALYNNDSVVWKAVNSQSGINASGWSHYGPTGTLQFMNSVSFVSVAVTPSWEYTITDMIQSHSLQGQSPYPLYYRNSTDYSGMALFGTYQASTSWYTGYKVTFTDSTNTAIASIEESGVRCRLYCAKTGTDTSSYGQELTYYAVTIPQFEMGLTDGTQIKKEAIINQNLGPIPLTFTNTVTVGAEVVYSSTSDTITEGSTTATFVGEFIVEV